MKIFRWRAIIPLALILIAVVVAWMLLIDRFVARTVEDIGAELIGARVDVASADVDLGAGRVRLFGIEAANPNSPMRNLVEASEISADIRVTPLLRTKVIVERAAVRGVRFGTERTTSGELENPSPQSGRLLRQISQWADAVRIPPLSLEGITNAVVNVDAISPDSLRTLAQARATVALADSSRQIWETQLRQLDPRPMIDSAEALVTRLENANPLRLGITGVTQLVNSTRTTLDGLTGITNRLSSLDSSVRGGVGQLAAMVQAFDDARRADFAYARSLLRIPSLSTPDLSASIFGETAVRRIAPVLYWMNQAANYLPPGLDPRRRPGPKRARLRGTTFTFPERNRLPSFLVELAELDLEIGGTGVAAGAYAAQLSGATTEPAVYGRPLTFAVSRTAAAVGPRDIRVSALLDHTGEQMLDSVAASLNGIPLPSFSLGPLGVQLGLGQGLSEFSLVRRGDEIAGRLYWRSTNVEWTKLTQADTSNRAGGAVEQVADWAQDLLWRTVSSLQDVEVEIQFSGSPLGPSLRIGSNIGREIAQSLRRELGREIERAEQLARDRVNELVDRSVQEATTQLAALQSGVEQQVGVQLGEVTALRERLEAELKKLTGGIGIPMEY